MGKFDQGLALREFCPSPDVNGSFRTFQARIVLGPVKKGTKANGSKIPQGEEWTHRQVADGHPEKEKTSMVSRGNEADQGLIRVCLLRVLRERERWNPAGVGYPS